MINRFHATGAEAINLTYDPGLSPGQGFQLEEITLHLSAAGGNQEDMTIDIVYKEGAVYTWRAITQAMAAVIDFQYLPNRPLELWDGDKILIQYANSNNRTWGLMIKTK
jgi:hypothetical protein